MLKALMARFADVPVLVGPTGQAAFEGCISGMASVEGIETLMNDVNMSDDSDFWYPADDWRSAYRPYKVKDGILTIPVKGVLLHNFPFQLGSWATGYDYIWRAYKRGMDDAGVKGIALHLHTPGGEVAGNFDLVDKMFALRGTKPVRSFAHEYAYSAGYSIASVGDHIAMSRTGGVGSIGVVTAHVDMSKLMDDIGYKITFIHAGKHKVDGNPYESLKPEVKERIQARINELYDVFVATVARNRGLDEKAVRDTEALTFSPSEAMSKGLADSVGPLDDAVAAFAADLSTEEGDEQMSGKADAAVDQAAIDTARNEGMEAGRKEGHEAGLAEGRAAGATAERERINAILDSEEGKKRPTAALAAALDSEMTVEQASKFLSKLAEETAPEAKADDKSEKKDKANNGQDFNAAMSKDKPEVGGGDVEDDDEDSGESALTLARSFGMAGLRQRQ